jgi:H+/Cl- antiporter ClcA
LVGKKPAVCKEFVAGCRWWGCQTLGAVIMVGTLLGLIALVYFLVLRFDPEARRSPAPEDER